MSLRAQRLLHTGYQDSIHERLFDEVQRSQSHSTHGHRDVCLRSHDDHWVVNASASELLLKVNPADAREMNFRDYASRFFKIDVVEKLLG